MVFAEGGDLQSALENNDQLFVYLKGKIPDEQIISLAPLLPSAATQEANRRRWKTLWSDKNRTIVQTLFVEEGEKVGFLPHAFDPFIERLSVKPVTVSIEGLKKVGLGDIIDSMKGLAASFLLTFTEIGYGLA
jgi:hypothetical protein